MRTWTVPLLAILLGGCTMPAGPNAGDGSVPLTWSGAFDGTRSTPGRIALLFDEAGPEWKGTMYFEANERDGNFPRVTYRIEGTLEDGTMRIHQREILQADPLSWGRQWCLGTYELSVAEMSESSSLAGEYSDSGGRCGGSTTLRPADTF